MYVHLQPDKKEMLGEKNCEIIRMFCNYVRVDT